MTRGDGILSMTFTLGTIKWTSGGAVCNEAMRDALSWKKQKQIELLIINLNALKAKY